MSGIELVATKTYHPSGVVTITIYFMNTIYVCVLDGGKENPLLDSRFPDVSGKGRGYQIQTYDHGQRDWPEIRKVSIWQTVSALEAEFRGHAAAAAAQAQAKGTPPLSVSSDRHLHLSGDSLGDDDSVGDSRHVRKKLFPSESTPVLSLAEAGAKGRDRDRDRDREDGRCSPLSSSRQEDSDVAAAGTSSFPYRQVVVPEVAEDKGERDRCVLRVCPTTTRRTATTHAHHTGFPSSSTSVGSGCRPWARGPSHGAGQKAAPSSRQAPTWTRTTTTTSTTRPLCGPTWGPWA